MRTVVVKTKAWIYISNTWAQFHNTLIRLRFNPIHFMQN